MSSFSDDEDMAGGYTDDDDYGMSSDGDQSYGEVEEAPVASKVRRKEERKEKERMASLFCFCFFSVLVETISPRALLLSLSFAFRPLVLGRGPRKRSRAWPRGVERAKEKEETTSGRGDVSLFVCPFLSLAPLRRRSSLIRSSLTFRRSQPRPRFSSLSPSKTTTQPFDQPTDQPQPTYRILDQEGILERQRELVRDTTAVLSIPDADATRVLRDFKWDVARAHEEWFADEAKVRRRCGLAVEEEEEGEEEKEANEAAKKKTRGAAKAAAAAAANAAGAASAPPPPPPPPPPTPTAPSPA